jgi:toxin-antitoxin system PIN domain toxin
MLLDANVLLYAVHKQSRFHKPARDWLTEQLNGTRRVGLPWQSLTSFLRIATHPRALERPLSPADAWARVTDWLSVGVAWVPEPGERHTPILGELLIRHDVRGNLVPDAQLAALALQHGLTVYSADTDFARFTDVRWENPLA